MLKAVPLCRAVQDGILGSPGAGRSRPAEPHSSEVTETGAASSAAKRKGQEKESASQRGQEKTRWGSEHPTQKWEKKKNQAGRALGFVFPTSSQHSAPGTPRQVGAVRTGGNLFPRDNPTGVTHMWHPNFSLHQLCLR